MIERNDKGQRIVRATIRFDDPQDAWTFFSRGPRPDGVTFGGGTGSPDLDVVWRVPNDVPDWEPWKGPLPGWWRLR